MQYKTIILELLAEQPEIYNQLRVSQTLLPTLNRLASQLRTNHQAWKEQLSQTNPASPEQIASEALETAIQEMMDWSPFTPSPGGSQPLTLDAAMAFLHRPSPPA